MRSSLERLQQALALTCQGRVLSAISILMRDVPIIVIDWGGCCDGRQARPAGAAGPAVPAGPADWLAQLPINAKVLTSEFSRQC